jgi:hypothetical protein
MYFFTHTNRSFVRSLLTVSILVFMLVCFDGVAAAPNQQINYQGKLTDGTGVAVPDGTYNMRFWLLTSSTIATTSAVWSEELTGSDKVTVTSGLFSIMLGSTSPLTGVDFNQTLYLGVEIGSTTVTAAWDGEMSPRKVLGAVPAAFEAENANTLDDLTSSQFVRTDATSTIATTSADTLLTVTQNGTGDILNLFDGGTEVFSVLDGGNVGIGTSSPVARFSVAGNSYFGGNVTATGSVTFTGITNGVVVTDSNGLLSASNTISASYLDSSVLTLSDIDTSAELAALLSDETGTGLAVFNTNPLLSGFRSNASSTIGDGTGAGGLTISGNSTTTLSAYIGGNLGIGTTSSARFSILGTAGDQTPLLRFASSTGSTTLTLLANGDLELPGQLISAGVEWTGQSAAGNNDYWNDVEYGNGRYVAVGAGFGTEDVAMHSSDGLIWATTTVAGNNDDWRDVTYGNGLFVAVGCGSDCLNSGDILMTSPDGIVWTVRSAAGDNDSWQSVTYGNGLFVAVSQLGDRVMTSPDGIVWTVRSAAGDNDSWQSVTYGNGLFVAVGSGGDYVMTSPDGINWVARTAAEANQWTSVTYGNGRFVAVSNNGTNRVMTSPDGINWTTRTAAEANPWQSVTYGNGLFVAVSSNTGTNRVMTSSDGVTWTGRPAAGDDGWGSVAYGNGLFVAVALGAGSTNRVMTSGQPLKTELAHNNIYQGGMSVLGGAFNIGTTTLLGNPYAANILNIASTTGSNLLSLSSGGRLIFGTTTSSDIFVNGGSTTTNPQRNGNNIAIGNEAFFHVSTTSASVLGNIAIGYRSLHGSSTSPLTGQYNIALGETNLESNRTGSRNIAIGSAALRENETGSDNNALGTFTLVANVSGSANNALGFYALGFNTSGSRNNALGEQALMFNDTGFQNNAIGSQSLMSNTAGSYNNAYGYSTLSSYNGTGTIGIGYRAGDALTSGDQNIIIGYDVDFQNASTSKALNIGNLIFGTMLDGIGTTLSSGNIGVGTSSPSRKLTVAGDIYTTNALFAASSTLGYASSTAFTLSGRLYDGSNSAGTSGQILQTTGSGVQWVSTSTLGFGSAFTTSAELAALLSDETGTGLAVFATNPLLTGFRSNASSTIGDGTATGGLTISGNSTTTLNAYIAGSLGIGSTSPSARLSVHGTAGDQTPLFQFASSTGTSTLTLLANGDLELPGQLISAGVEWTEQAAAELNNWYAIAYGAGRFVAVSISGSSRVMYSDDGITWATSSATELTSWRSITYGNGLFVAVASNGTNRVMTSPDGIIWTARSAAEANLWYGVTYGNGQFVAVAWDGTNRVMTSPDGIIWTARSAAEANQWTTITYGNGLFVAVANSGTNRVMTSPDGINWTARAASHNVWWNSVIYGDSLFVAAARYDDSLAATSSVVMVSRDAITWTKVDVGRFVTGRTLTYGNGLFVLVSSDGLVLTSPDGVNWKYRESSFVGWGVTYGNGRFVSVGQSGSNRVMTSGHTLTTELAHNNTYQGGMSVLGGAFNIGTTTPTGNSAGTNILNIATTTGASLLTLSQSGYLGIGTTSPSRLLTVQGDIYTPFNISAASGTISYASSTALTLSGSLYDTTNSAGTLGQVLQSTGTSTRWVATSTLGFGSAFTTSAELAALLSDETGTGLAVFGTNPLLTGFRSNASSTIGDGTGAGGLTVSGNSTTTLNAYIGGSIGIGTTSPSATFALVGSGTTDLFRFASSTGSSMLSLNSVGHLRFGTTTTANIYINGGNEVEKPLELLYGNVGIGEGALRYATTGAVLNVAIGSGSLVGSSTAYMAGAANIAIGYQNLFSNVTGYDNIALGTEALYSNVAGAGNIALGNDALIANISGNENIAIGGALTGNQTGSYNIALGYNALGGSGSNNIAQGYFALSGNQTGGDNIAFGTGALQFNQTGDLNVALGYYAGLGSVSGRANVFIGSESGSYNDEVTNSVVLGQQARVGRSNSFVIGGVGTYNLDIVSGTTTPWAKFSLMNNYGSTTPLLDIATTTSAEYATSSLFRVGHDGRVSLGSTTPESLGLTLSRSSITGSQVAGIKKYLQFTNNTASAIYYGDNTQIINSPTATSTLVGEIIRITDNSQLGNTVRGLEVQAHRGTTTRGENTGISGFGRTFGVRGTTEGDAGDTFVPAGVFAESRGTTQGNALRAYSGTITTTSLVNLFQDTSAFTGTGLLMNFGNSGGSFSSTTSKFIDLQNAGTSKFTVTAQGTTTIGDGTTSNMAGLQIGYGGLCVDNDGSCVASTTGRITSVSSASGNSDLAEMYFSSEELLPGDIVALQGGLSIARAEESATILGVVSTKPGLIMGFDDTSLTKGESAFPVALKGRVPVRLSTENGPIQKGDRIALSSIPGVGMKATASAVVVGIALEDFDGEHAYSPAYLNQFGDDLVKAKMQPRNQNMDARTQDGCSYGGGSEEGGDPCEKDAVGKIKVETVSVDNKTEILNELEEEAAEVAYTEVGNEVSIGQVVMFVDLDYYQIETESTVLAELLSSSTLANAVEGETVWTRLQTLAKSFVDGVLTLTGVVADKFTAEEVETNLLCVGETCVDEATLKALLESRHVDPIDTPVDENPDPTPPDDPEQPPEDPAPEPDPTEPTPEPEDPPQEPEPVPEPPQDDIPPPTPPDEPEPTPEPEDPPQEPEPVPEPEPVTVLEP